MGAAEKQQPAPPSLAGVVVLNAEQLAEIVRAAVASGVDLAMDKMDRARAAEEMTKKELAEHLGKTERTIENWLKKGLPSFMVGNERRFRRGEVEEFLRTFRG